MNANTIYNFGDIYDPLTFEGWCEHTKSYIAAKESEYNNWQYIACKNCGYRCFFDVENKFYSAVVVKSVNNLDEEIRWNFYKDFIVMSHIGFRPELSDFGGVMLISEERYELKIPFSLENMNAFIEKILILK